MSAIRSLTATAGCAVLLGLAVTGYVRKQLCALEAAAASGMASPQPGAASGPSSQASEACTTVSEQTSAEVSPQAFEDRRRVAWSTKRPSKAKNGRQAQRGSLVDQLDRGITKVAEGRYQIERRVLDLALGNLALLSGSVRVAPDIRDGKPAGFRLFAIAPDGPFARLGLRNEDVLVSVNRLDITTAEQVLEAYGKLKTAKHLVLGVLRGGRKTTLEYAIR